MVRLTCLRYIFILLNIVVGLCVRQNAVLRESIAWDNSIARNLFSTSHYTMCLVITVYTDTAEKYINTNRNMGFTEDQAFTEHKSMQYCTCYYRKKLSLDSMYFIVVSCH